MSAPAPLRLALGQRPDGRPLVTNLATGEIWDWPDAVDVQIVPGDRQVLWLGVVVSGLVTTQAAPAPAPAPMPAPTGATA